MSYFVRAFTNRETSIAYRWLSSHQQLYETHHRLTPDELRARFDAHLASQEAEAADDGDLIRQMLLEIDGHHRIDWHQLATALAYKPE